MQRGGVNRWSNGTPDTRPSEGGGVGHAADRSHVAKPARTVITRCGGPVFLGVFAAREAAFRWVARSGGGGAGGVRGTWQKVSWATFHRFVPFPGSAGLFREWRSAVVALPPLVGAALVGRSGQRKGGCAPLGSQWRVGCMRRH
ncbi:hypothetical protein GCM10010428_25290 [Actinosynnema pretiosum subsp. pretiosum]